MPATSEQLAILYRAHAGWVHRRCRHILGNDEAALDAVQEVFARAFRSWDTWDGRASRLTWLSRIATHHCLNEIRNHRTRRDRLERRSEELVPGGPGPSDRDVEHQEVLRAAMAGLDEDLVRVAMLYYLDEMTLAEVAEEVGLSVPTVRKRLDLFLRRARARLHLVDAAALARALPGTVPALLLLALSLGDLP